MMLGLEGVCTKVNKVRIATASDAAAIAAIYAPIVRDTAISFETEPPTPSMIAQRIREGLEIYPWLTAERDGRIMGYAYASKHRERSAYRWSADVSTYVDECARRSGVGRALYGQLIAILREQGFHAAFAGIALPNAASIGLHEAMGFQPLGIYKEVGFKLGSWHDVGWWRLGLTQSLEMPGEPVLFSALRNKYVS